MTLERVIVLAARKNAPESGQVLADVLVGDQRARCVVSYDQHGTILIQRDPPIERSPNVWWAVNALLGRIHRGEPITFPLDLTVEAANGPW